VNRNPVSSADDNKEPTDTAADTSSAYKSFSEMARAEISEGDAYMHAGKYNMALHKFIRGATLDPSNKDATERINPARKIRHLPQ
jgi:hypothetical protein